MSRILITGGSSYLGQHLVPMASQSPVHEICYTFYKNDPINRSNGRRLNVRDETAVRALFGQLQPDVIIHTVGSNQGPDMDLVIREGTLFVTRAAADLNVRLIHLSTDVIFDGLDPPYDESAQPNPVNDYGRAKADAETIVRSHHNHVIIRTSLIYGLRQMDRGTLWMAEALRAGQPVFLFSNQRRNPVWVETLSQACLELAGGTYTGALNVAGRQTISRADFAIKMLDWWGISNRDTITIGPSTGGEWPLDCELDLGRADRILHTPLWGVDDVLKQNPAEIDLLSQ